MSNKKNSIKDKKAAVLGKEKKAGSFLPGAIALAALIIILLIFFIDFGGEETTALPEATVISKDTTSASSDNSNPDVASNGAPASAAGKQTYEATDTRISYPIGTFDDGKAKYFEYPTDNGKVVRYFILKSSDGIVRAAFDACDVCWQAGKGYEQSGDVMICRNCGKRFASERINEVQGGCNPAPLTRRIENGKLIIDVNDILGGEQYFNLDGRRG